jgi:hypothetical protein
VIRGSEDGKHGTEALRVVIQSSVKRVRTQAIRQRVGTLPIGNTQESVVLLQEIDAFAGQCSRQGAVTITVELKSERRPRGHTQIAQPQFLINKIKVV